jgi:hypothetical protein
LQANRTAAQEITYRNLLNFLGNSYKFLVLEITSFNEEVIDVHHCNRGDVIIPILVKIIEKKLKKIKEIIESI